MKLSLYLRFKDWWLRKVATVDHQEVLTAIIDDGQLTQRYMFMVAIASGIATIGLLLNSPAVIIGAMLVSPLMGPIALTGMSLAVFDFEMGQEGALGLLVGTLLALAVVGFIVLLSPLTDATPEILARTRPNLFDLLVAVLSGLAGGYAMIRGRGGAIVGVAIATALMPPLAVVGYGVVLGQWAIAKGASLLFLTNISAISVSAAFVATWYGFGRRELRRKLVWQTVVALLVFIPISIPLLNSLQAIVGETLVTRGARRIVEELAVKTGEGRIQSFQVGFNEGRPTRVDVVLLTRKAEPSLEEKARQRLEEDLKRPIALRIDQIQVADLNRVKPAVSAVANPVQAELSAPATLAVGLAQSVMAFFPLPTRMVEVDEKGRRIMILPETSDSAASLGLMRQMEKELATRHPDWLVLVIPGQQALPKIFYPRNVAELSEAEQARLQDIIWALKAWGATRIVVVGYASSAGEGPLPLASERANRVAEQLRGAGFEVRSEGLYPAPNQRERERDHGYIAFQAVEVRLDGPAGPAL